MSSSSGTSMSSKISSPSSPPPKVPPRRQTMGGTRHAQCTHLTMTRLYTDEFRCSFCLQPGSMGWLWRCTQDRELLIEDDLGRENHEHLDKFSTHFPLPENPRERSPAARTNASTFLSEITRDQFKEYTTEQIVKILEQRKRVLEIAKASSKSLNRGVGLDGIVNEQDQSASVSARYSMTTDTERKPWLPELECQFKCCQKCRPNCRDRSFLSLNAIADGEYQPSAVAGFGFHLQGKRPVIPADLLQNIGLRPCPKPKVPSRSPSNAQPPNRSGSQRPGKRSVPSSMNPSPFNDEQGADTTFSQPPVANFYDSTAMTRSLNAEVSRSSYSSSSTSVETKQQDSPDKQKDGNFSKGELPSRPAGTTTTPRPRNAVIDTPTMSESEGVVPRITRSQSAAIRRSTENSNLRKHFTRSSTSDAGDIGLQRVNTDPTTPTHKKRPSRHRIHISATPGHRRTASKKTIEEADADEEDFVISAPRPLTPMEEKEKREGSFSNEPLEVTDGVALTEEAVALHLPDVITQF